jgi:hypothetical protein
MDPCAPLEPGGPYENHTQSDMYVHWLLYQKFDQGKLWMEHAWRIMWGKCHFVQEVQLSQRQCMMLGKTRAAGSQTHISEQNRNSPSGRGNRVIQQVLQKKKNQKKQTQNVKKIFRRRWSKKQKDVKTSIYFIQKEHEHTKKRCTWGAHVEQYGISMSAQDILAACACNVHKILVCVHACAPNKMPVSEHTCAHDAMAM